MNGWLALVLYLVVFPAFYAYQQNELNKAWAAEDGPVPGGGDGLPPELERAPDATTSHTGSDPTTMQAPIVPSDRPSERPPGA
jgi:hypothetical protein